MSNAIWTLQIGLFQLRCVPNGAEFAVEALQGGKWRHMESGPCAVQLLQDTARKPVPARLIRSYLASDWSGSSLGGPS